MKYINKFRDTEDGAVTVDWVVLTAAVCGLALAAFASINQGSRGIGFKVNEYLTDTTIEDLTTVDDGT
jgi:hypothetical protein